MSKFSVSKPFTVLVLVLAVVMLGVVSVTRMQMDLLPEFSLPYLLVITTYPGASPEKVEKSVSEPLENALGTINGVENIFSHSYENYSMVQLEFADGTDMDSVLVKVSTAIDSIDELFPEECGTPNIMELSLDMMATQYLAVAYDGMNMEQLSRFVDNEVLPAIERQNGVASVTSMGMIDQTVHVELNQAKVDELNAKILGIANDAFDDALSDIEDAKKQLEDAEEQLEDSKKQLVDGAKDIEEGKQKLIDAQTELDNSKQQLVDGVAEIANSEAELANGQAQLDQAKQDLKDGKAELEKKKQETYDMLANASEALDSLQTYKAELVAQQATLKALEEAIKACEDPTTRSQLEDGISKLKDGVSKLEDGISQIKQGKEVLNGMLTLVQGGIDDPTNTVTIMAISAALYNNPDTKDVAELLSGLLDGGIDDTEAETIKTTLAGVKDNIDLQIAELDGQLPELEKTLAELKPQLEELEKALADLNSLTSTYKDQKTALELEIEVTKAIISGYEGQLASMGVNYTDIEKAKMEVAAQFGSADAQMIAGEAQLISSQTQLDNAKQQLSTAKDQLNDGWDAINDGQKQIDDGWNSMKDGQKQIDDGWNALKDGQDQIDEGWESYYDGLVTFDKQRKEAIRTANADKLLSLSTISSIIYAQNFEMPAGYIDDENDDSWLLKIGNNISSLDELENMVLANIDDIGDIKIKDVADITIIDNTGTTYTKLNGNSAVILSIFKSSTSGTNDVSRVCKKAIDELKSKFDGLNILVLTDQGDYIDIIVNSVVQNMIIGAGLAIFILALFLKDFMPTIVVAISIPLSVLVSLVCMYFSGVSLNMMSLSGMALGIGMLVDNSVVVIENIYRLRGRGVSAPRAAVQGAKQVAGSVIASTLTTVCVFFPMVYTSGMTRDLLLPMALTIIYTLLASLLIAMTVVPAAASTLLRNTKPKNHPLFDKIQDVYGASLAFCLKVKILPLALAILLLAFSIWQVVRMGIVMIPDMSSGQMTASIEFTDPEMPREKAYEQMNTLISRVLEVDGVGSVGAYAGGGNSLLISTGTSEDNYLTYSMMVTAEDEKAGASEVQRMTDEINAAAADLDMEFNLSSGLGEMSSLLGSGISISVYGRDVDTLLSISNDLVNILSGVEGLEEVSNGQEEANQVLHLNINKDYAMSHGLTVAQVFQEIAGKMTTSASAVTINIDGVDMDVEIINNMDPITVDNIMDYSFGVLVKDEKDGNTYTQDMPLSEFATLEYQDGVTSINRENQKNYINVTASVEEGYNATLISRQIEPLIKAYEVPEGYSIEIGGESESVNEMIEQMSLMMLMGLAFIYFVMVAQFQSLLSPFIVLFTVPLAFTGGLIALWFAGESLSVISLMGFVVLLGTVVNNGIVFVDYANQLRIGGMERHDALIATGKTRMRPILMTAMTTILAEASMIFGDGMSSQMGKGMALVIAGGLLYATLMTLYIIPVMYDILFKRAPLNVDLGSENLDDVPDDAKEFMEELQKKREMQQGSATE